MFEIRPTVPPDVKAFRKAVTKKYGIITVVSGFLFILLVSLINYLACRYIGKNGQRWAYTRARLYHNVSRGPVLRRMSRLIAKYLSWNTSITVVLWTVGLTYLIFNETLDDMTFLVKRLGRVSVGLMPPMYFLTLKPSPLPRTFYLQLLPFHKWLSRVVVILALFHGILYFYVYLETGKLKKLYKPANINGILAAVAFIMIGLTSLPKFRRQFYSMFYTVHYILAWGTVVLVFFHASPTAYSYMTACGAILLGQLIYRISKTGHAKLPVQYVSDSLYMISIPYEKLPISLRSTSFTPGAHVRISTPLYTPSTWFHSSHPYTVASLPYGDHLKLVVRKTQFPVKLRQTYSLYGPFNSLPNDFLQLVRNGGVSRALFVIGGSGIAFGVPVFRFLKTMGVRVKLLWAIKDIRDTTVLSQLDLTRKDLENVEIYISPKRITGLELKSKTSIDFFLDYARPPNEDENLSVSIEDDYCYGSETTPLRPNAKSSTTTSYASFDDGDHHNNNNPNPTVLNHRLTLNNRLKYWLWGLSINENECSCLDYVVNTEPEHLRGCWVISSGANDLVNETKSWAHDNGFSFLAEEFAL